MRHLAGQLLRHRPDLLWDASTATLLVAIGLSVGAIFVRRVRFRLGLLLVAALLASASLGARIWLSHSVGGERLATLRAMHRRPGDPWPRGRAHVPLGPWGAAPLDKGYLEPGGSYSPSVGSFGVSIWVVDSRGAIVATSDTLPLSETTHAYVAGDVPSIQTTTPYYTARWSVVAAGSHLLELQAQPGPNHLEVVLRGVGPAGGPLRRISRLSGGDLLLNSRWRVRPSAPSKLTFLGTEGGDWRKAQRVVAAAAMDRGGWAAARLQMPPGVASIAIQDEHAATGSLSAQQQMHSLRPPALQLPGRDDRFDASVTAQIVTMNQGVIGDRIPPGEPVNYPNPWLRDGAYVLVALSRAGERGRLEQLAQPFAQEDFFGGFGAEADAPGLALWALGEVSATLQDQRFDRRIWPDVQRKVGLIREMLSSRGPIDIDPSGPTLPGFSRSELRHVADAARDGLINGRMDWHEPIYYVNAVSYRGLVSAAELAERTGHLADAAAWRATAKQLRSAWREAFRRAGPADSQLNDDRTAAAGLWPAEVADPSAYGALLDRRWRSARTVGDGPGERPLWTYFTLAEAHQWLRRDPEKSWATLRYFWANQPIPGLYTLWEGKGEENTSGAWRAVRGWADPPEVTPHYWSAAEMLLLQLAMLAEVEGGAEDQVLVIGPGVPANWLAKPFAVKGVGTGYGPVDWAWSSGVVSVRTDLRMPVRLGPAFPAGTKVQVSRRTAEPISAAVPQIRPKP